MATAFAALVSLEKDLHLIQNHPRHSFSFEKEQIDSLMESVSFFIDFMESFDNSHGAIKEAAEALESRIACAVHAAEDVIESHVVDQIRSGSTLGGKTRSRFLLDLQKAVEDMDYLRRKALNVGKSESGFKAKQPASSATAQWENDRMVGFDGQLLRLLDLLTGTPSSRRVISIVGMGGIGKTTLATNALQHPYIVSYFDVCLWATVSQEFSVHKILTDLLSQLRKKASLSSKISSSISCVNELGEELYKNLFGRRYLIVLDDIWSAEAWYEMKFFFPDTSNGSRIVVTTRQSDVARHLGSLRLDVSFLDEDSSWDLFCEKTFEEQGCPPELEDIGKKIVEKCRGLPLEIVVIGGHLKKSSRSTKYWENVANNMNSVSNSRQNDESLNILSLSYRYLPVHLKPCFLFLGVFQEDEDICVSELLSLWIGEGFIQECKNLSMEEIAMCYLVDLCERNLVSTHGLWLDMNNMYCRIHDLVRELCLKIAKIDKFFSVVDTRRAINRGRRVVIRGNIPKVSFLAPRSTPLIRALICEGGKPSFDLKLLRVMNKVDSNVVNFQQVNLRYLKVDVVYKSYLPSSIALLWNLQTLIINAGFGSIIAPYEIWEMSQLRHIEINELYLLDPLPIHTSDQENALVLEKLHKLSTVKNFRLSEEVCRRIPNIKKLQLSYRDELSSHYCLHNLGCFQKLESLEIEFYSDHSAKWCDSAINLAFPNSLERLKLSGCCLCWEELTMKVGSLPRLEYLKVTEDSVAGSEWTLVEGAFPCLKCLVICRCDLVYWNADKSHFPVLEFLGVCMPKLDEFPLGMGEIPTLSRINLVRCSMSSTFSAMRMLVEQEEQGNEGIQLYVYLEGDEETLEEFRQKVEEEGLSNNIHLNREKLKAKSS